MNLVYFETNLYFIHHKNIYLYFNQIRSVAQSCPTLCNPMNCSTPGLPVHHQLPEFTETHVHRVSDAIQPSHPLSSPSLAPNPSQQSSYQNEIVCPFSLQILIYRPSTWSSGFTADSLIKSLPACTRDDRDPRFDPTSGRSPGEGNGNPLQYSCLGNPTDREAWQATVHGVLKSQTWLSN